MGVVELPSVEDDCAMEARVPQVANLMPSERFRLLKRVIHFNDIAQIPATGDHFFNVRPLFSFLNNCLQASATDPQTVCR